MSYNSDTPKAKAKLKLNLGGVTPPWTATTGTMMMGSTTVSGTGGVYISPLPGTGVYTGTPGPGTSTTSTTPYYPVPGVQGAPGEPGVPPEDYAALKERVAWLEEMLDEVVRLNRELRTQIEQDLEMLTDGILE
jgi:hypothetical protein